MSDFITTEYNAFGPWIYIINETHPIPPIFERFSDAAYRSIMAFKIPRNIERRKANENMHLYDCIVCIFKTSMLIVDRDGDDLYERRIEFSDVHAIRNFKALLKGELTIYTKKEKILITYNTVSDDIISQAIHMILDLSKNPEVALKLPVMAYTLKSIGHLFKNTIDKLRRIDDSINLIAYQPERQLSNADQFWGKLKSLFSPELKLLDIAFTSNNRELIIISRSSGVKDVRQEDYAYTYMFIPYHHIRMIDAPQDSKGDSLKKLHVGSSCYNFELTFDNSNIGLDSLLLEINTMI